MYTLNDAVAIDISLVTCAEYQLFLDEMRAQGTSFRPDHWSHEVFQSGTGSMPVLGVRRNDAIAFCDWLTVRSSGLWKYRLPHDAEWQQVNTAIWNDTSGITGSNAREVGFWANSPSEFIWLKGTYPDLSWLNEQLKEGFHLEQRFLQSTYFKRLFKISAREQTRALDILHTPRLSVLPLDLDQIPGLVRNIEWSLNRKIPALADNMFTRPEARKIVHQLTHAITDVHSKIRETITTDHSIVFEERAHIHDLAQADLLTHPLRLAFNLANILTSAFSSQDIRTYFPHPDVIVQSREIGYCDYLLNNFYESAIVYAMQFLLLERIAGTSSANEGILLVKERK